MTKATGTKHRNISDKILPAGIVIAASFWGFDSVVDTFIIKEGDFFKNLLAPGLTEVWMRLVVMVMIIGTSFYARKLATGRMGVEEALRAAVVKAEDERTRSEAIIAGIGDGVSIQDTEFKILYQNQAHKNIIGDHVGEYCYRAYKRRENVCEGCPLDMSFKDGKIHTDERSVALDEEMLHVEITASPLRDSTGRLQEA
jgi:PAS domain-containing protein